MSFLSLATMCAVRSIAMSISSRVFIRLKEKRIDERAVFRSIPMFVRTRDGSRLPELQAEPWAIGLLNAYPFVLQSSPFESIEGDILTLVSR